MESKKTRKLSSVKLLTEHGDMFYGLVDELEKEKKPILSIDELEQIDKTIKYAINKQMACTIFYYSDGIKKISGNIHVDVYNKIVIIGFTKIRFDDILKVSI